jgi:hypothetical protein
MRRINKFLLMIIILLTYGLVCKSQTRANLERDFGQSKMDVYSIKPGILLKADYDEDKQASIIKIFLDENNLFGDTSLKFISRETGSEIVETLSKTRGKGKFVKGITFSASCSSTKTEIYENVKIAYNLICSKEEPQIKSIHLIWNKKLKQTNKN